MTAHGDAAARRPRRMKAAIFVMTVAAAFALRVRGVSDHFWLLGDQTRDWWIALGSFDSLPFVGPPTHVGGYTIGPAFYWILWLIRVVFGPWYQNLPHAGGIGQALLQSAIDGLLLLAVWRRTQSIWIGLATVILLVTAPFDLSLAPVIWNPVVGSALAKAAIALVLLGWHRGSAVRAAITAAVAWSAVHAYTGTIFVALSVFAALLVEGALRRDWRLVRQRGLVIAGVVGALQVPYLVHRVSEGFSQPAMGAVTGSIADVVGGGERLRLTASAFSYMDALILIQGGQWDLTRSTWILLACGLALAVRWRRDPELMAVTLLPQLGAVAGYSLWLGDLQAYYYLSLLTPAVLTFLIGATAPFPGRLAQVVGALLLLAVLSIVPERVSTAATMVRMPTYSALVAGSKEIVKRKQPMRSIEAAFELHPTSDPAFLFRVLGGHIDPKAEWRAVILPDGRVSYLQ